MLHHITFHAGSAEDVFVYALCRDAVSGDLLEGVVCVLEGDTDTYEGTSDSNGHADLGLLPEGTTAELTCSMNGYETLNRVYPIVAAEGETEEALPANMSPTILVRKVIASQNNFFLYSLLLLLFTGRRIPWSDELGQ